LTTKNEWRVEDYWAGIWWLFGTFKTKRLAEKAIHEDQFYRSHTLMGHPKVYKLISPKEEVTLHGNTTLLPSNELEILLKKGLF